MFIITKDLIGQTYQDGRQSLELPVVWKCKRSFLIGKILADDLHLQ